MKKITQFLCVASLVGFAHLGQSQISITGNLPQNYTQNFDDALGTNTVAWANEVTIPGWSIVRSTNNVDTGPVTQVVESDGNFPFLFIPGALNLGTTADPDRALGARPGVFFLDPSLANQEFFYGARFVNNTLGTITNVNISYNGEQWRDNNATPQTINFFYREGGTDFIGDTNNVGWTALSSLDFTSPNNAGMNVAVDGNAPGNRTALNDNISVNIAPGETFWIRWADIVDDGLGDHLSIDDVNITFNGINPPPALTGVTIELKKPKVGKKLKLKTSKGINKVKGFVFSESNAISKVSYAAFGGTNTPTNLVFIDAGKFKVLTKGKLFKKKGVDAIFASDKNTRPGIGITEAPVTLLVRVFGGSNGTSQVTFTNIFTDVKIK